MYRIVYDVQDDSILAICAGAGFSYLGFSLLWLLIWYLAHRFRPQPKDSRKQMRLGFVVGTFFAGIGLYIVFTRTIPGMQEQQRCRDWLKENNFQTVEGVIANYPATRPNKSSITFDVSGHRFTVGGLNRVRGGFNLRFTGSGLEELQLQNGMAVRISHREGRILRIEIAE